jgi:hypothetical protein
MERLVFESGPMQGEAFELVSPEISVGREQQNRLQLLGDRCVSRRHARFVRDRTGLFVEDLGSKNGTLVNGRKIANATQVALGDHIQIAHHRMRVELSPLAFGPSEPETKVDPAAQEKKALERSWMLGFIPSLVLAPLGVLYYRLAGLELVPFALILTGLALALVGIIKIARPAGEVSGFERAFIQTLSGSSLAIIGAIWLNALR